jgi:hypothetical protein
MIEHGGPHFATRGGTCLALLMMLVLLPAEAARTSGPFRLAPGHAARPAFYFVVDTPGTINIAVEREWTSRSPRL